MKKEIIVLGIGNPLMSDEGIGGFLVEQLQKCAEQFDNVEFVDAGTGGMSILHLLEDRKKAILIDCAYMESSPGTIRKFTPKDVQSVKQMAHRSLHEADILKVLDIAKELGQCPETVVIFGIEPQAIELGQKLADTLSAKIGEYIDTISKEFYLN